MIDRLTRGQVPPSSAVAPGWVQVLSVPVRQLNARQAIWTLPARGRWDVFASCPAEVAGTWIRSYDQTPGNRAPSDFGEAAAEGWLLEGCHRVLAIAGRTAPQLVELGAAPADRDKPPPVLSSPIQLWAYGYASGSAARGAYRVVQLISGGAQRLHGTVTRIHVEGAPLDTVTIDAQTVAVPTGGVLDLRPGRDSLVNPEIGIDATSVGFVELYA